MPTPRRGFLRTLGGLATLSHIPAGRLCRDIRDCDDAARLAEQRIAAVRGFRYRAPRPKYVGKNSHLEDHGDSIGDTVLVLVTNKGVEGFGSGRIPRESAKALLGQPVSRLWDANTGSISPLLGRSDHALFDLLGKILDKPAWSLLGGTGSEWTPVYDGSIYFNDLIEGPDHRGIERLLDEVDMGLEAGFLAFKIKIGRGFKWMTPEEGMTRDIEVVRQIRRHVGTDVALMVDANNGFTCQGAIDWLRRLGEQDLSFVEEMFAENIEANLALKQFLREQGSLTKVADGESADRAEHFSPFLDANAIDILQPDIRAFGLSLQWALAREIATRPSPARIAAHNWGSHLGLFMQLTLARGRSEVTWVEVDRCRSSVFDSSAYEFKDGRMKAPHLPGCGVFMDISKIGEDAVLEAWSEPA